MEGKEAVVVLCIKKCYFAHRLPRLNHHFICKHQFFQLLGVTPVTMPASKGDNGGCQDTPANGNGKERWILTTIHVYRNPCSIIIFPSTRFYHKHEEAQGTFRQKHNSSCICVPIFNYQLFLWYTRCFQRLCRYTHWYITVIFNYKLHRLNTFVTTVLLRYAQSLIFNSTR